MKRTKEEVETRGRELKSRNKYKKLWGGYIKRENLFTLTNPKSKMLNVKQKY